MNIKYAKIYQTFKYVVYALLSLNIVIFFMEEWAAAPHRFAAGIGFSQIIEGFAATIDTAAWVVLLLMFELETYILDDRRFTRKVTFTLHGLRALCYAFIIYAFYGYLTKLLYLLGAAPAAAAISDLCALGAHEWAYAVDLDEYKMIDALNCSTFSQASSFFQFPDVRALVDKAGLVEIIRLAWVDVINAGVWLLVVLLLEIDVRLQEHGLLEGSALRLSNAAKWLLYSILFLAAVYWGFKGDFVDFWDAFLWLVAFVFIEMNVFEWRQESLQQKASATA